MWDTREERGRRRIFGPKGQKVFAVEEDLMNIWIKKIYFLKIKYVESEPLDLKSTRNKQVSELVNAGGLS